MSSLTGLWDLVASSVKEGVAALLIGTVGVLTAVRAVKNANKDKVAIEVDNAYGGIIATLREEILALRGRCDVLQLGQDELRNTVHKLRSENMRLTELVRRCEENHGSNASPRAN